MIKGIVLTIIVLIGLMDYALLIACSRLEDKESYEAFEGWCRRWASDAKRWKEERKNERSD